MGVLRTTRTGQEKMDILSELKLDRYIIKEDGSIYSKYLRRYLKQSIYNGYKRVSIMTIYGKGHPMLVHRLIAFIHVPNPQNKSEVNHIDGNKLNNNASNLEWVTSKENSLHAISLGIYNPDGFNNPQAKLTEDQVDFILAQPFEITNKELAKKLNVSETTISRARRRKTFKNHESIKKH